jgi:hypothetical protein
MLVQTANVGVEYHKIDTLFDRDPATYAVIPDKLRHPVIATISQWDVTEKIDGTNIRVMLAREGEVTIGGRTNNAQLPADFHNALSRRFTPEIMQAAFWLDGKPVEAILFGEGYGAGIQKGGAYRPDKSFILFDVLVDGKWWLDKEAVDDVALKVGCEVVPYLGRMTLDEIVKLVQTPFQSRIGVATAEGIVARPIETLFDKKGQRLIIKLKTKDFKPGKR